MNILLCHCSITIEYTLCIYDALWHKCMQKHTHTQTGTCTPTRTPARMHTLSILHVTLNAQSVYAEASETSQTE